MFFPDNVLLSIIYLYKCLPEKKRRNLFNKCLYVLTKTQNWNTEMSSQSFDCTTPLSKPFLSKFFFFRIVCRIYVWTKFLCLRKVCLRNLCLRNVSLRKVCLRNMCLRKKSLSNVCLSKVCLRKVCLRNVCLRKVCLRQVCLESYTNFS